MADPTTSGASQPLHSRSPEHLRNLLAFRVDCALDRLRTSAVLERNRWWRPFWQAGYDQGLREAHEAAQQVMLAAGARWPADPMTTDNAPEESS